MLMQKVLGANGIFPVSRELPKNALRILTLHRTVKRLPCGFQSGFDLPHVRDTLLIIHGNPGQFPETKLGLQGIESIHPIFRDALDRRPGPAPGEFQSLISGDLFQYPYCR